MDFLFFRILLLMTITTFFVGCGEDSDEVKESLPDRQYELTWEDNFDGVANTLPDDSKWTYDIGGGGWGNNELQYYTDRPENVSMDGLGNLVMTAKVESFGGRNYTSARIKTQGIFSQTYGRFEARLKTPSGQGLWPAFWMLGDDIVTDGWPLCGEIDIMELRGQLPEEMHGSIHGPGYSGGSPVSSTYRLTEGSFDTEFHVFAIEWGEDFIDFYVDDERFQSITPASLPSGREWVFDDNFFIILNIAVGGSFVGSVSQTVQFPQTMVIDYVRVYKQILNNDL